MRPEMKATFYAATLVIAIVALIYLSNKFAGAETMPLTVPPLADAGVWLNSKPLQPEDLKGKVVLIDIWEFTCVNCQRTLPYLKEWQRKYADQGLVIVGVHCPEFEFGKDSANVARFVKANGLTWPIVLDNNFKIWTSLYNQYWPRKFIFDASGKLAYDHTGEGGYAETEQKIQELLAQRNGKKIDMPVAGYVREEDKPGTFCYPQSPETYAGYKRGHLGNVSPAIDRVSSYPTEDSSPTNNTIYIKGDWEQTDEYLRYAGHGSGDDRLTYRFTGNEVNVVLRGPQETDEHPVDVVVTLDDQPVPKEWFGQDVKEKNGKSVLELREPRMYRVLYGAKKHGTHLLKFYPTTAGFELFAFTFGSCSAL